MSDQKDDLFAARDAISGVLPMLVHRWSPRAFAKVSISEEALTRIMDATRWAPSCFNEQPWRFYTSTETTFDQYLSLLNEKNQEWARNASVIGFLVGKKHFTHNGKPNNSFELDCGAAWMAMSLQARNEDLYTHGMAGIKHDEITEFLHLDSEQEQLLMAFAIGKIGDKSDLPENFQKMEAPNGRKPLTEIWVTA